MFIDPAGQYKFALPLDWAYDPQASHLITVQFARWEHPGETLSVRALPAFAPPESEPAQWYRELEATWFPPRMQPFTRMQCGGLPAALAETHDQEPEKVHRRLLVVRGTRLDVSVEHRAPEPSTGPRLSEPLAAICRSLEVGTNRYLPAIVERDQVHADLELALRAAQRQAWQEVKEPATRALHAAQATYLYSVVANTPLPEIPAIMALIDALTFLAQAGASLHLLRNAEHLALRALYTLRHLPFVPPQRRHQVDDQLSRQVQAIGNVQNLIARHGKADGPRPAPGLGSALQRVDPLLAQAVLLAESGANLLALWHCETAVADLLTVLGCLERESGIKRGSLPPELAQQVASAGAATPEAQWTLYKQLSRHVQLDTLQRALVLRSHLQSLADDEAGAAETSELLVKVARSLSTPQGAGVGGIQPSETQWAREAHALIEQASCLAAIEDAPSLEDAHGVLDEAEKILDQAGEEAELRAHLCLVRASMLHSQRRVQGAVETIDRGLRAAAAKPGVTEQYVRELKTIKSQFLIHLGRLPEARDLATEVVNLPEGKGARARRDRANHYLNLAIIEHAMVDHEAAARSLREALCRAVDTSPFSETALRTLMVGSRLFRESNPILGYQLNLAAAATLDARRVAIGSDRFRVGFDEAIRRREVYEDLVGRALSLAGGFHALEAADRSRARSLNELLTGRAASEDGPAPAPAEKPPPLDGEDVQGTLSQGAEYVLRAADAAIRRSGTAVPLRAGEVEDFMKHAGAPCLLIQPVRQRVALLLARPSGQVRVEYSPFALDDLLNLVDALQKQFFIRLAPRGENGTPPSSPEGADLHEALAGLWDALIRPIAGSLEPGEPLIIVPYREFTLIPFGLLQGPDGRPLMENHAASIVPSLATLRVLKARGGWTRRRPQRAYLAGDPAISPRFLAAGLARLPAARAEAEAVAVCLREAGVGDNDIILRLDQEAHEESYRREARGCDLVHLSCHAKLGAPAHTSCLYFAPQGSYDGMLMASEVADVKVDDALVFLAACETGQGRATADGIIGLGRAFLEAGARAVILSLWKVEDAATAALSWHFYRALLNPGRPRDAADALRVAMLATRADLEAGRIIGEDDRPLPSHPATWGPFMVLGDGLSIRYQGGL